MKLATLTCFLSLLPSASALAQTTATSTAPVSDEAQTLTSDLRTGPSHVTGWFLAPTYTTSRFDGSLAQSLGIQAGVLLDRRMEVGIAAHAVTNQDSYFSGTPVRSMGAYGGLLVRYLAHANRLVHATVESTLGFGRWCVEISDETDGCVGRNFLMVEPLANLELNVSESVRLAVGVGYRLAVAGDGPGPGTAGMSSPVARASLLVGHF